MQIQKESLAQFEISEERIGSFCQRLKHRLVNLSFNEKRLLLDALAVKVIVSMVYD